MRLVYIFRRKDEAESFFHHLNGCGKMKKIHLHAGMENSYLIRLDLQRDSSFVWKKIVQALIHVFIIYRLPIIGNQILQTQYYYENKHEIAHIIPILQSIMQNPKKFGTQSELLTAALFFEEFERQIRTQTVLHFDEWVEDNIKEWESQLFDVTGYAIDEWKREEDYQEFIHSIRTYLKKKQPKMKTLHITYDKEFQFYNPFGKRLSANELKTLQTDESFYILDVSNEFPLSVFIAIAPAEIFVYTNFPTDLKIITLQNIFHEKVHIHPLEKFPYIGKKA
jgi:putative sporulation protein YtxC